MNTKLIGVIIGASIAILMSGSILMPVINDAADDTKVYYNNDFGVMAAATDESITYSIRDTGNDSGAITETYINGVKASTVYDGIRAIVISDSYVISQVGSTASSWRIYTGNSVSNASYSAVVSTDITINITSDRSVITYADSDGAKTLTIDTEWCYYRDDNSTDYRIVDYTGSENVVYVNDLKQVRGASWINTTGEFFNFEGTAVNVYGDTPETPTMVYEGYTNVMNGVYSFDLGEVISGNRTDGVHFNVDNNGTSYTVYPFFLVIPNEIYGQTETNESYTALLYAIPVILLTAIAATIALMFARRY